MTLARAIAAFERGAFAEAAAALAPLLDRADDPRVALLLGEACRQTGDDPMLMRAAARLATLDPAALRPLIWQGDIHARRGANRQALMFYSASLNRAAAQPQPPALIAELRRIESAVATLTAALIAHLDRYLREHGLTAERRSARIAKSLRILAGDETATMTLQRPTAHYLPGLPQMGWHATAGLGWVAAIEAQTPAICAELSALLGAPAAFRPYIEGDNHGPRRDYQGLLDNPAWSASYLWRDGRPVPDMIARCPATAAALALVPRPAISGRSPTAMFSLLAPRTRIPPHHGMLNARLIAHLPLIVPPGCAMRVGAETRPWTQGRIALFDDSVEHEAWNDSDHPRVVLLFDVWHPALDDDEKRAVDLCFAAMDAYAG